MGLKLQVSKRECELCRAGILKQMDINRQERLDAIEGLRREVKLSATIIVSMTGLFITILGYLIGSGVI